VSYKSRASSVRCNHNVVIRPMARNSIRIKLTDLHIVPAARKSEQAQRRAKENIAAVFTRLGGTAEMAKWAKANQTSSTASMAGSFRSNSSIAGR